MIDRSEACAGEAASTDSVFNGVGLSTRVSPANDAVRGGDWCETFVLSRNVVALSIGDVCGHGEEQFAAMMLMRSRIREAALLGADPAQTLCAANGLLCDFQPRLHATALFAWFDTQHGIVTFANAGHPPPLLVDARGCGFLSYEETDPPLGIETGFVPLLRVVKTPEDALLILYTDGVTEHSRRPLSGEAQLCDVATFAYKHCEPPTATLIEELMFTKGSNGDDASILTVRTRRAPHPARTAGASIHGE